MPDYDFEIDTWPKSYTGEVQLSASEDLIKGRLRSHVWRLASEIGERNNGRPDALELTTQYVQKSFKDSGLPGPLQQFVTTDGHRAKNIEAIVQGSDS